MNYERVGGDSETFNESNILRIIKANPKLSANEIANNSNIPLRSVERMIRSLKEKGKIKRHGTKNGYWEISNDI